MSVESRIEAIEIPTYVWGPEDPNPPFQRRGYWSIYPYSLMDDLGEEPRPVKYRAMVVENEYLRVIVLPELGGRLYSALDKPTGQEIFYRNNVVKPGLIGLRGAWVSGGIEFNFPRGHSVTTISQVDGRLVEEEDGSATVWVGNVERIFCMGWSVGIRLRPHSSVIETEIRLSNRTPLPHPYYFWANAGVPAREDMRLVYPCTKVQVWDRTLNWPVHEGRDLATYFAHDYQGDIFGLDSLEDFFGAYYEGKDFGVVHIADVHDACGKKFFTWGTSDHGKVWAEALSDGDGPYCELQSGRFVDQSTWRMFPPHHTIQWREYWYAVKGTGGFSWANQEAAVRVVEESNTIEYGVLVTQPIPDAVLRVSVGGRIVYEQRAALAPDRPVRTSLRREPEWPEGPITLTLSDGGGRQIIQHTEGQQPRTATARGGHKRSGGPQDGSVGELLRDASRAEQRGDLEAAWSLYERVLTKDPAYVRATIALGRLAIELRPDRAIEQLSEGASAAPESAEAAYYLGLAGAREGRLAEAEFDLWRAGQDPQFAHAAHLELGLIAMRRRDPAEAARRFSASLGCGPDDIRAACMRAAALRHGGCEKEAAAAISAVLKIAPHERLAAAEAHFCAVAMGRPRIAARHLRALREQVPAGAEPWLELAFDYAGAGLFAEAAALLEFASKRLTVVRRNPLVHYAIGYCLARLGREQEAGAARRRAVEMKPDYVFPYQWEMESVLKEAIAADSEDPYAHYYLGNLLYGQGRRAEALQEWEAAAERIEGFPVLFRNLGMAHREVQGDLEKAEEWLRRAAAFNPPEPRTYLELAEVLRERKASPHDRLAVLDGAPVSVQRRGVIAAEQAVACMAIGDWDRAIALMRTHTFHRWEMEFRMRRIWVDANLGRGAERFLRGDAAGARDDFEAALEYPRNLRIGKPPRRRDARPLWCAGVACETLGDLAAANAHWERAAGESHHHVGTEAALYRALSLRKLGRTEEGDKLLAETLTVMEQCASLAPEDANTHLSRGLALKAADRPEEAAAVLRHTLGLDPWLPRAKQLLESDVVL